MYPFNKITEKVKVNVCAYLIERYCGQFFESKIGKQLDVELTKGKLRLANVKLNVQALNELSNTQNWPLEFTDGLLDELNVHISWTTMLTDSVLVQVKGLKLTLQPKERNESATSVFESMWDSMSNSLSLAKECVDNIPADTTNKTLPGLEMFAELIDSLLSKIRVQFIDTVIQIEYTPKNSTRGVGIVLNIDEINYRDEAGNDPPKDELTNLTNEEKKAYVECSFTSKFINMKGISLSTLEFSLNSYKNNKRTTSMCDSFSLNKNYDDFNSFINRTSSESFTSILNQSIGIDNENDFDEEEEEQQQQQEEERESLQKKNDKNYVILFGKFSNEIQIGIQLKKTEELKGPKVSINMNLSSLVLMLSPRQLHLLIEFCNGLLCPEINDQFSKLDKTNLLCKPMSNLEYQRVQDYIRQQVETSSGFRATGGLCGAYGWSYANLDDGGNDDNFLPMNSNNNNMGVMYASSVSGASSSMESSIISSVTSSYTDQTSRTRRQSHKIDTDPTAEISRFDIHLSSLAVILLHEDLITVSNEKKFTLTQSSVNQMKKIAETFFKDLNNFVVNDINFANADSVIDKITHLNHIRILAAPLHLEGDEKTTSNAFSITGQLQISKLNINECLYENGHIIEHVPLIKFTFNTTDSPITATTKPSFTCHFKHVEKTSRSNIVSRQFGGSKTDFTISLNKCIVELDVTLIDRISAVLHPHIISNQKPTKNWNKMYFDFETTATTTTTAADCEQQKDSRLDIKIVSPSINVKLRFPVTDFRPAHDMNRIPWWKRNVRKDYLTINLINASLDTCFLNNKSSNKFSIQSKCTEVYYNENSICQPLLIGKSGYDNVDSLKDIFCKLDITINPTQKLKIEEEKEPHGNKFTKESNKIDELNAESISNMSGLYEERKSQTGPFSAKKVVHQSDTVHHKSSLDDCEELLLPGEKEEINEFIQTTIASSKLHLDITLPTLSVQLLSKHLYELIYNRINNDLLLWQPNAPIPKPRQTYYNDNDDDDDDSESDSEEEFRLCRNFNNTRGYSEYTSDNDNSDEDANIFHSAIGMNSLPTINKPKQQTLTGNIIESNSLITINLQIKHGLLNFFTPVRDSSTTNNVIPNQNGEFLITLDNTNLFIVNGYKGDVDVGFVCVQVFDGQLYHCEMMSSPSQLPTLKEIGRKIDKHLQPTLHKAEIGMLADAKSRGGNRDLFTLAIRIQGNHETHHIKNITLALGLNKITLKHRMCIEQNYWITQLLDFFNVKDYPIPGYNAKDVLTELYLHFWDSLIDYRPKYLPLRTIVTLGNFSVSSHLSSDINVTRLRFIAEECGLFLSDLDSSYLGPVNLKRDYVNLMELGLFEISLKTTDKKFNKLFPHSDLRASNDIIHINVCVDSARMLTNLIKYLANNGDLIQPETSNLNSSIYSSPKHTNSTDTDLLNMSATSLKGEKEEILHERISELITDAVKDVEETHIVSIKQPCFDCSGTGVKEFYFPNEKQIKLSSSYHQQQVTDDDIGKDFVFIDASPDLIRNSIEIETTKITTPIIKWLINEPVNLIDDHFQIPVEKSDPLKAPKSYPIPITRYALCEMSLVISIYGGNDFMTESDRKKKSTKDNKKLDNVVSYTKNHNVTIQQQQQQQQRSKHISKEMQLKIDKNWHLKGGINRNHNVLAEFEFKKIRYQYDIYPETTIQASRQILLISEIEIRDRLKVSNFNKFLYQQTGKECPKQTNANMLAIKILNIRPDLKLKREETCLKVSFLPLRLNIDQDTLQFIISFFKELGGIGETIINDETTTATATPSGTSSHYQHQPPIMSVNLTDNDENNKELIKEQVKKIVDENLLILLEDSTTTTTTTSTTTEKECEVDDNLRNNDNDCNNDVDDSPIYFRNVIFTPNVPIKLDYHGKYIDMTSGSLAGLLMGLGQLNYSEIVLKRISYRKGILGIDNLFKFLLKEWLEDIKKNQLQGLLIGVGPIHLFIQLTQGIRDLFWLPFEQYRKDGRILRGLHRGANSFTTSTAIAFLELTTRFVHIIQVTAETAFDMLTPGPSFRINPKTKNLRKRYGPPKDFREGVTNAYQLVKEGIEETADNIVQTASHEHEQKGYSGAIGGVVRQLPLVAIGPFIYGSEATNNVLGGMRSQLVPEVTKEDREKYRVVNNDDDN